MAVETSTGKPYKDKPLDTGRFLRKFDKDIDTSELIWHRDKKDRVVRVLEGNSWKLQYDDQLPFEMVKNEEYFIEAYQYHRIIKGRNNLVLEILEKT